MNNREAITKALQRSMAYIQTHEDTRNYSKQTEGKILYTDLLALVAMLASGAASTDSAPQGAPSPAPASDLAAEIDKENARWQDAIHPLVEKLTGSGPIDASGCDSGDPLDYTLTLIEIAFNRMEDAQAPATPGSVQAGKFRPSPGYGGDYKCADCGQARSEHGYTADGRQTGACPTAPVQAPAAGPLDAMEKSDVANYLRAALDRDLPGDSIIKKQFLRADNPDGVLFTPWCIQKALDILQAGAA